MSTKVITGKNTRFSYLNANEPKSINGGTAKYSASLIIPKDDTETINKIKVPLSKPIKRARLNSKGMGNLFRLFYP